MQVLVTGAAGYIGSHVVKALHNRGYVVDTLDRAITTDSESIRHMVRHMYHGNITERVVIDVHYDAVIHCAALISVEESMRLPLVYYEVNTAGTLKLLQELKYDHFIFASTGGAFDPISPYAKSKIIAEEAVRQIAPDYSIFRFFNVAGNDGELRQPYPASHIIRIAAEAAAGKRDKMVIFGKDYGTSDGTCIRDYVHVVDLAEALVQSVPLPANSKYECIGSGRGYTNLEVINTMKEVTGIDFPVEFGPRRSGDPAKLLVDTVSKYVKIDHDLKDMCHSAYTMELK
jgi:UDP-glucose 4-epimerase